MKLEDFIPFYPSSYKKLDLDIVTELAEFISLTLTKDDKIPTIAGVPTKYQLLISRLLSGYTMFDSILLCHEMGTGKTCTAVHTIELNYSQKLYGLKKALILTKGKALINNFINETIKKCTDNNYTRKSLKNKYTFFTFETFAKVIKDLPEKDILLRYNDTIVVIDEVHNIKSIDKFQTLDIYGEIHRFLHILTNKKVLLLTGTPMKDSVDEIASLMNLILPLNSQLPIKKEFIKRYFTDDMKDLKNVQELKNHIYGYVSFLKAKTTDVNVVEKGVVYKPLKYFKVIPLTMSPFQTLVYLKAYNEKVNIYNDAKQASLFVFPSNVYGEEGFNHYVKTKADGWALIPSFLNHIKGDIQNIKKYSIKYFQTIETLLNSKENSFVFCEAVQGSGLILFSLLLELAGFSKYGSQQGGRKYAMITSFTSTEKIGNIINVFNKPENINGKFISILLGSKMISEGFTLKNVHHIHILTPHWNFSETAQVIARAIRLDSHTLNKDINIYKYVALPDVSEERGTEDHKFSIDLKMYDTSEKKDVSITKVLDVLKESAIDCTFFKVQNGPTPYKCDIAELRYHPVNNTTNLQILYPQSYLKYVEDHFSKHFYLIYQDDNIDLLITLNFIIFNNIIIRNKYGINCYLNYSGNIFYIVDKLYLKTDPSFGWYTKYPNIEPSYMDAFNSYKDSVISEIFSIQTLNTLPDDIQQLTLEYALQGDRSGAIVKKILDMYSEYFTTLPNKTIVVWYLYNILKSPFRCLEEGSMVWKDCSKDVVKNIQAQIMVHNVDKKFKYYGLVNHNDFCIRLNDPDDVQDDKRKIQSGKRCINWKSNDLIKIFIELNIRFDNLPSLKEANNVIQKKRLQDLEKEFSSHPNIKQLLGHLGTLKKDELCRILKLWFKQKNILFKDSSCGTQLKRK